MEKMLNGQKMIDLRIVTNILDQDNIQQHGIDLNVIEIKVMKSDTNGYIPASGKTLLPEYDAMIATWDDDNKVAYWQLEPGVYSVTMAQGCKIPNHTMCLIRQRSSLLRCGALISSSIFDAGFETKNIGTVMIVHNPIVIEVNARIACMYAHPCNTVLDDVLYAGQWQGK
jgi:deoxycytidine triphosphate deaminase